MGILIRLAPAIVAGYLITQLTACFSAGGRVYLGYEVQDEVITTVKTHPNQMSITDRLWRWATTDSTQGKKVGDQTL